MSTLTVMLAFAALFVVFAAVRQPRDCGGDCGACLSACRPKENEDA